MMFYHSRRKVNVALNPLFMGGGNRKIKFKLILGYTVSKFANSLGYVRTLSQKTRSPPLLRLLTQQFGVGVKMLQAVSDDWHILQNGAVVHTELKQDLLWGCTMQPRGAWRNTLSWLHFDFELIIGAMFGDPLLPDLSSFMTTFCCTAPQLERLCPDHLSRPSLSRSFLLSSPLIASTSAIQFHACASPLICRSTSPMDPSP